MKLGIFEHETELKATDSDPYVKLNIGVIMSTSHLCAPTRPPVDSWKKDTEGF
jgi:hypothetical protein